jgi:dihydroorotate dehydrogenase subfamily 2
MRLLYRKLLKPVLFRFDPESVHDVFVALGERLGEHGPTRRLVDLAYGYRGVDASADLDGLRYRTPVVLAAGFDYDGRLGRILPAVGFGGVEVGSVTARPSAGNPPPRLRRLVRSRSLVVNKGLRNEGVDRIIERLRAAPRQEGFVTGVSIARTNDAESASLAGGIADYATSLERLVAADVGDYYTINISCPNVHGGESFAHPVRLGRLLERLVEVRHERPMYAKMPIDVDWPDFHALLQVVDEHGFHGVVIGNLNKNYDELDYPDEAPAGFRGGLSGRPCFLRSNTLIRRTRAEYGDRFSIIGCGGILSPADAMVKLDAGADLLQLITGMIFDGPHLMKQITRAYARREQATDGSRSQGRRPPAAKPAARQENIAMKTLIYGAGPLGSLFAARLHEAGCDVSLLARGQRLADLREHGVVLDHAYGGRREVQRVPIVEALGEDDDYDLVIVVMRKNQALQILPDLARNRHAHTVLFLMNNAAGPAELVAALGAGRVMVGFPSSAGYRDGHVVRVMPTRLVAIPIGEVDGRVTERTRRVAALLDTMRDKHVRIRTDMDAWLVTHVSALAAVLGVYAAGVDPSRYARTRDAIVLGLRARVEAMRAQRAAGIPVRPASLALLPWMPEPVGVAMVGAMARSRFLEVGIFGHAAQARDEIRHLLAEFRERVAPGGIATPALDRLADYVDKDVQPMPDGRSELPMRWGSLAALGAAALVVAGVRSYRKAASA